MILTGNGKAQASLGRTTDATIAENKNRTFLHAANLLHPVG